MFLGYKNCAFGDYHDFEVIYSRIRPLSKPMQAGEAADQVEVCRFCKKQVVYKVSADGKTTDDHQYFLDHIRAFAQVGFGDQLAKVFYECNPGAAAELKKEQKSEKKQEEKHAELGDKLRFALKRAFEDKDDGIGEQIK